MVFCKANPNIITISCILINTKGEIFQLSYAVLWHTTYTHVTAVLEYLQSAFRLPRDVVAILHFHHVNIINSARPIKG